MDTPATICVVDDEPAVLRSLTRLLRTAGHAVVALRSARELLEYLLIADADCIVTDFLMPEMNGLELQRAIEASSRPCPMVFISGCGDVPVSVDAMKAGAVDFLTKPVDAEQLLNALRVALRRAGEARSMRSEKNQLKARYAELTARERQVFHGVVAGLLNKQIAARLGTVEKTIKVQRGCVMRKMAAHSVVDLVRMDARLFS